MENFDPLKSIWQSQKGLSNIDVNNLLNNKNSNVMEIINQFETKEKAEKKRQIIAAIIIAVALALIFLTTAELTPSHFMGIILFVIGLAFSILLNRTDNFPDFNLLDTLSFLKLYRENTIKRSKRHITSTILGLLFVLPGFYLIFKAVFEEIGDSLIIGMVAMVLGLSITLFLWFRAYNKRSKLVLEEVSVLLDEFKEED